MDGPAWHISAHLLRDQPNPYDSWGEKTLLAQS